MKNKAAATLLGVFLSVCFAAPAYAQTPETAAPAQTSLLQAAYDAADAAEEFSCSASYVYGEQSGEVQGYLADDGIWYIFEPSTQPIEEVELHYTGDIESVTGSDDAWAGEWDAESKTVTGAFRERGDQVVLTAADETAYTVKILQSDLPSVCIQLGENKTIKDLHASKDEKIGKSTVAIMDPSNEKNDLVANDVEMKGRGNSTWIFYDKKGYQIKFDKKTDVFGLGKAKKWVLLANAADDSMMRSKLVYDMAENMDMDFVTSFEYVDLWINGEYRGTYLLGEKAEIGSSRLNLKKDTGALFEHDEGFYQEEEHWLYSEVLGRHFTVKEIGEETDENYAAAMEDFEAAVDDLMIYLYSTPSDEVTLEKLSSMIDVDSFAKYYLINEFALNRESFVSSFYWYKDGPDDVLHLGPVWDFDTCMGNDGCAFTESYGQNHTLFRYLMAAPEFYERTQQLKDAYWGKLTSMADNVDVLESQIADSAQMNYLRWDTLGKPNPKGGEDFHKTFAEAADAVQTWLTGRNNAFKIEQNKETAAKVSDDCRTMTITFRDEQPHDQMRFFVWSNQNGQDDMKWYYAQPDESGTWSCRIALADFKDAGLFSICVYSIDGGVQSPGELAVGCGYVPEIAEGKPTEKVTLPFGAEEKPEPEPEPEPEKVASICMFRLYNPNSGEHFYTGNEDERRTLEEAGWNYEGIAWNSPASGGAPVYRVYNPNAGDHHYTMSKQEVDDLVAVGWNYEGVGWNSAEATPENAVQYRLYNPNAISGAHHYTGSIEERDNLIELGWSYEGIAWYGGA